MTLTQLYLFMVILPNLHEIAASPILMLPIFGLVGGVIGVIGGTVNEIPKVTAMAGRSLKYSVVGLAALLAFYCVSPSDEQIYMMAGGYVATNTKDVAKLPDNLVKAANAWLDKAAVSAESDKAEAKPGKKVKE